MRGKGKRLIIGLIALAMILTTHHVMAQDAPFDAGDDVVVREVTPELETMGLIFIKEGDVKKIAYVVQTGDTLWDIAERFLNSPYYWPKIWERNTFIINPHLIFPGDILYIYPEGVTQITATSPGSTVTSIEPIGGRKAKKQIVYQSAGSTGFIAVEELESAGKIAANFDQKELLGDEDVVYVDVGKVDRVLPGDRYSIFRMSTNPLTGKFLQVKHPVTGKLIGYQVSNLGELSITKVEPDVSEAVIENAYREIHNNDLIKPFIQPLEERVDVVETGVESLKGYIIANKNNVKLLGINDIVYIDRGADDGVMRGNAFVIYKPCEIIDDKVTGKPIRIPEKILGHLVLVETRRETSIALITDAVAEITIGEMVFMSKYSSWEIEGISQPTDIQHCESDPTCRVITKEQYDNGEDIPFCEGRPGKSGSRWKLNK